MHDTVPDPRPLQQDLLNPETGFSAQARHEPPAGSGQLVKEREGEVAQVKGHEAIGRHPGQDLGHEHRLLLDRVVSPPQLGRQVGGQVHRSRDLPGQGNIWRLAQAGQLAEQGFQCGGVQSIGSVEAGQERLESGGQRPGADGGTLGEVAHDAQEHTLKEFGREGEKALGEGGLADRGGARPEHAFTGEETGEVADTRNATPNEGEDDGNHDRQGEQAGAQAELMIVVEFGEDSGLDECIQASLDLGVAGSRHVQAANVVRIAGCALAARIVLSHGRRVPKSALDSILICLTYDHYGLPLPLHHDDTDGD